MEIVNNELTRLARLRKADKRDVHEFLELVREAEELFLSDADLSEGAALFTPITDRAKRGMTSGDLRKLIFEACNILEESPLRLYIAKLQLESKQGLSDDEKEALESANWRLDTVKKAERQSLVEKLRRLKDRIEK